MSRKDVVTMGGNAVTLFGEGIKVGDKAPNFEAVKQDMSPFDFYKETEGKIKLISVAPSIDTGICSLQGARFNEEIDKLGNVEIVQITVDLPFAQKRYCGAEGIENIQVVSDHKSVDFGKKYGFLIEEARLLARGIVVVDADGVVKYVEYTKEVATHVDYDKALEFVKAL